MKQLLNHILNWKTHLQKLILPAAIITIVFSLFTTSALATGVYEMPNLTAGDNTWVVDEADVLSRVNKGKISNAFEDLASKTGIEVRITTIRRLDYGETPQSFTQALFEKWFPTPETQANQAILMIDTLTNNSAIVRGEKVKSVLPDDIARSIANETLLVPLRAGNKYNQAFVDASDRLATVISGQPDPGPPQITENIQAESTFKNAEETERDRGNAIAWVVGLLIAATVIPMATYYLYQVNQPSSDG
ncbi:MAG: TPM domain-containing protein [Nostocaceae cyanobacterium]|nr:TPM domain-containing protein [Nostocaceae cyanobacterium]